MLDEYDTELNGVDPKKYLDELPDIHLLRVANLVAGYGKKRVLDDVGLEAAKGEVVAIIGHNGAGKSTLLKALFGLIPVSLGEIWLDGRVWLKLAPYALLVTGVAYVPQGNRVFEDLTVRENLEIGSIAFLNRDRLKEGVERVFYLFPALKERLKHRAGTLSGGQKQMLALASALVLSPRLLLLDEPSLGLAPPLVSETLGRIEQISREQGVTVLVVEQKVREVLRIAQRVYVLRNGRISFSGMAGELRDETKLKAVYL